MSQPAEVIEREAAEKLAERSPWASREERTRARERKRAAVLRTAVQLFNRNGFRATSLDDVARRLKVTKPTIYHYFDSKDEILFECVRLGLEEIESAVRAASAAPGHALDRLAALIRRYAEVLTMDFGRSIVLTDERELSPASRAEFRRLKRAVDARLRTVIAECVEEGSVACADVRIAALAIASALNGMVHWFDPRGPLSVTEVADMLVRQFVSGLAPRFPTPARPRSPRARLRGDRVP